MADFRQVKLRIYLNMFTFEFAYVKLSLYPGRCRLSTGDSFLTQPSRCTMSLFTARTVFGKHQTLHASCFGIINRLHSETCHLLDAIITVEDSFVTVQRLLAVGHSNTFCANLFWCGFAMFVDLSIHS